MSKDIIYREDAIEAMEQRYQDILRIFKRKVKDGEKAIALDMIGCIKTLPSTDRPNGTYTNSDYNVEWYAIEATCNLCGEKWMGSRNFCPNCGANMKKRSRQ